MKSSTFVWIVAALFWLLLPVFLFRALTTTSEVKGQVTKTYCNGSTGFCTTDKTDGRLKNPDNAPTAPEPPTTDLSTGRPL